MAGEPLRIVFLLFDGHTALDVVGPHEVLSKLPGAKVVMAAKERRLYRDLHGLGLMADAALDEAGQADVLVVPGGFGVDALLGDGQILDWVRAQHAGSRLTLSVCAGALVLAQAGLLKGLACTTHWGRKKQLMAHEGVLVRDQRWVRDGKVFTSAGVTAGMDMALAVAAELAGPVAAQTIQLALEYDPQPPFDSGSPAKAPKEVMALMAARAGQKR